MQCKLPQRGPGRSPVKFAFWNILGPQKSRQNGQLAFESGEGGNKWIWAARVPPSLPQRRSAPGLTVEIWLFLDHTLYSNSQLSNGKVMPTHSWEFQANWQWLCGLSLYLLVLAQYPGWPSCYRYGTGESGRVSGIAGPPGRIISVKVGL